ncbi:transporter associated domain-containing protein [Streptomyces sp. 5.8]|uniref:transporter associated domain-containing protein n=1 Tax=Streptomyces sp. 5.8 TaxID=3406571 RepID=UPI003BB7B0DA
MTAPDGPCETLAGLIAARLERLPVEGDTATVDGWELTVLAIEHHRADRVSITAPAGSTQRSADDRDPATDRRAFALIANALRRRRVRRDLRKPQPDDRRSRATSVNGRRGRCRPGCSDRRCRGGTPGWTW